MSADPRGIEVVVNGESLAVPTETTVEQLVSLAGAPARGVAVALEGEVVPRSAWRRTTVAAGAKVGICERGGRRMRILPGQGFNNPVSGHGWQLNQNGRPMPPVPRRGGVGKD